MSLALYKDDSIESLSPREHVQLRAGMYIGSTSDATQLAIEIIGNAIDEYNIGHGDKIIVNLEDNGVIQVQDYGQGFPINVEREDGETVLQAAFDVMNTSGKFHNDGVYDGVSVGLNGIGSKASNFLSSWLEVISSNSKGQYEHIWFKDGIFQKREVGNGFTHSGTSVTFKPSEKYFTKPEADLSKITRFCDDITCLCQGLTIILNSKEYYHSEGIKDLLQSNIKNATEILDNQLIFSHQEGKQKMECGLTYTDGSNSNFVVYVNCGQTTAGPHITSIKSTLTKTFNKWAKEQDILGEKDKNLDGSSLQEGIIFVCNITAEGVAYDAQVKSTVTKIDTSFITSTLGEQLELWLDNNPDEGKTIIERALIARKAAEAAKKARATVKQQKIANRIKILHPDKLKDAEYLGEDSTLLISEGLSAGAAIAQARDEKHYGVLMLRGKLINCYTNNEDKLMKNEELQLLFKALNQEPHNYNPSKLRYGKIGICTDSDADGYNIGMLIMTAVEYFWSQMIDEGRLCWLRSPLFIVKNKSGEDYYFTDKEFNLAKEEGKVSGEVQRNKGLGSLSADQMKASMFGKNQRLDVFDANNEAIQLLRNLMGKSISFRKQYIFNNVDFSEVHE